MNATVQSADRRQAIYAGLTWRNRVVGVLRLGVPIAGVTVFLVFAAQIFIANLRNQFDIGNVSFSGDTVTVDTPAYSGVLASGDVYNVSAQTARTAVSNFDLINLSNAQLILTKTSGTRMIAKAEQGAFTTTTQVMTVPGTATVSDSDGNSGTLEKVTVSLPAQTLKAEGHVALTMADGTTVDADGLDYDAAAGRWDFHGRTVLTMPQAPDDGAGSSPEATP